MNLMIITPVKDEEQSLSIFIERVLQQTIMPIKWYIINDNSTDNSRNIILKYAEKYSFIQLLDMPNKKDRATGANIVRIINYGLKHAKNDNVIWDVFLKLDADILIENNNYFAFILSKFSNIKNLGIASGSVYFEFDGKKIIESKNEWHTQGQTKFYSKSCFNRIGGLKEFKGWDGIDDVFAREYGFTTRKFFEQPLRHLYKTQTRLQEGGLYKGLAREALGYRNRSYPLVLFFLKSVKLSFRSPFLLQGLYFFVIGVYYKITRKSQLNIKEKIIVYKFLIWRLLKRHS